MWYSAVGFLVTLTLSLLAAPLATTAQPRGKTSRIGVLEPGPQQRPAPCIFAFQQGLRDLGYVEGQNILIDYRYAEDQPDRLPALAAELVQLAPDVIWLHSDPAVWAAKLATTTIPIVFGVSFEPVEQGIVASLARPGGNLTGLEFRGLELAGKCLELFKDAVPPISRVAVLVNPAEPAHAGIPSNLELEAQALGVQLQRVEAGAPAAFEAAFAAMVHGGADALMIMDSVLFTAHRQQLMALALQHRLPTMAYGRHIAEAGSLLAYGGDPRELCQRSAVFVHKILHGAKPADLPIERATFQLVVNLKTAAALGVTFPQRSSSRPTRSSSRRGQRCGVGWRSVRKGTDQRSRAERGGTQLLRHARIGVRGIRTGQCWESLTCGSRGIPSRTPGVQATANSLRCASAIGGA